METRELLIILFDKLQNYHRKDTYGSPEKFQDDIYETIKIALSSDVSDKLLICCYSFLENLRNYIKDERLELKKIEQILGDYEMANKKILEGSDVIIKKKSTKKKKKDQKITRNTKKILKRWVFKNKESQFPTEEDKKKLSLETGLDSIKIDNWFIKSRKKA